MEDTNFTIAKITHEIRNPLTLGIKDCFDGFLAHAAAVICNPNNNPIKILSD